MKFNLILIFVLVGSLVMILSSMVASILIFLHLFPVIGSSLYMSAMTIGIVLFILAFIILATM